MARRCHTYTGLLDQLLVSALSGCSTRLPLVSHAHVGHALTVWHDTPDRCDLMDVASGDPAAAVRNVINLLR